MNKFFGIKYNQGNQQYITTIMSMKFILENYTVLVYGEDPIYGYQRSPKPLHYNKIAKEITKDINSQVTPNSIILGINDEDIDKIFYIEEICIAGKTELISLIPNLNKENIKLRVIDGQHRIKGFEKALKEANDNEQIRKLEEYNTNVIIMILTANKRSPEVNVFSNINAKAKPLKMDLTLLAEYQYALLEKPDDINMEKYVIVRVIKELNFNGVCKPWTHGIILDVNAQKPLGSVGFKTFYSSIEKFCRKEITIQVLDFKEMDFEEKKKRLDELAEGLAYTLSKCWTKVFNKWPGIKEKYEFYNDEKIETYYDDNYYLQRTMGVSAINSIVTKCFEDGSGYNGFCRIIDESKLTLDDWKITGRFTGLSSMAGISQIEKAIRNEL